MVMMDELSVWGTLVHSLLFWDVLLFTIQYSAAVAPILQYQSLLYTAVGSSFIVNVGLQFTPMVLQLQCGWLTAFQSFWIGLHLIALHVRQVQIIIDEFKRNRVVAQRWIELNNIEAPAPTWRRVLESSWTWLAVYNLLVAITSIVSSISAPRRVAQSCFAAEDTCYIDLGESVAIAMFTVSILSTVGTLGVLWWWGYNRYARTENAVLLGIQLLFLTPALIWYTSAHEHCDRAELEIVRVLIVWYNTSTILLPFLPVLWIRWNDWHRRLQQAWFLIRSGGRTLVPSEEPIEMADNKDVQFGRLTSAIQREPITPENWPLPRETIGSIQEVLEADATMACFKRLVAKRGVLFALERYQLIRDELAKEYATPAVGLEVRRNLILRTFAFLQNTYPVYTPSSDQLVAITRCEPELGLKMLGSYFIKLMTAALEVETDGVVADQDAI
jgi:hypothetical protein